MGLSLAVLLFAAAQQTPGPGCALSGQVADATGAVLPGAVVAVSQNSTRTVTSDQGQYCLQGLRAGTHEVVVSLRGFLTSRARVEIVDGREATRDFALAPAFSQDVVVTATRTMRLVDAVPVRTEVIGREAIKASAARTLADAVEFTTGVRVENNCQNCNFSQIRLLGLEGPYTQILVDSQPIISSLAQVYGIEHIPARMIDRIEVVKGGGSALYGAGAVGGVINIVPREAMRTGGMFEARFENGGSLNGALDWVSENRQATIATFLQHDRVDPVDVDDDGFTEVARRKLTAFGTRGTRFFQDGRARLTIDFSALAEDRRGGDALDAAPHEANVAEWIDSQRTSLSGGWIHGVNPRVDYRLTVAAAATDRDSYYGTHRDPAAYGQTTNLLGLIDGQLNVYVPGHILSWGGQLSRDRTVDEQPAYHRRLDDTYFSRGVFLQDDWTIRTGVQLLSGVRADWHSALSQPIFSPRVALMLSPSDPLDFRISVARGFRAPQVFDEDLHLSSVAGEVRIIHHDPALSEERATNVMAGVEWKPTAGRGQALFEVNGFYTRLQDLFHVIEQDDPATNQFEMMKTNLGGASVYGVELNAGWGIGDDLILQGGFVAQRARFDDAEPDFSSQDFFRTPRHYGNATIRWSTHNGWNLFAGMRVTGSMKAPHYAGFVPSNRLDTTPVFVTFDTTVGRRITMGTRTLVVTFAGRNLTNAYQRDLDRGSLRDAAYVYGPRFPRSIGVLARVEF